MFLRNKMVISRTNPGILQWLYSGTKGRDAVTSFTGTKIIINKFNFVFKDQTKSFSYERGPNWSTSNKESSFSIFFEARL
jgi:hypothetical protein